MRYRHRGFARGRALLLLAALTTACERTSVIDPPVQATLDAQVRQVVGFWGVMPIGEPPAQTAAMVDLGQALFFDKLLSGNKDVSCGTCHVPGLQLIDGLSLPVGTGGSGEGAARVLGAGREFVPRNAPSLMNTGLGFVYTLWDGRVNEEGFFFGAPAPSGSSPFRSPPGITFPAGLTNLVAAQAMLPVLNRVEMRGKPGDTDVFGNPNELAAAHDTNEQAVWNGTMARLLAIQAYVSKFNAAFPSVQTSQLGFQHAANAIAAFQIHSFTRSNSAFDRFLARDNSALTEEQKHGALLFFGKARCSQCHNGALLGGQQFANIAVPQIGPGVGSAAPLDIGRAEHLPGGPTQNSFYRFAFRVPALRNVELTAPYMHNGAFKTLETVVRHYTNPDSSLRNYDPTQLDPAVRSLYRGDATTINDVARNIDGRLLFPRIVLTPTERQQLVAFLKSLTDPAAMNLASSIPASVPSGLPVR
jgi:cytochrome c peroxidase